VSADRNTVTAGILSLAIVNFFTACSGADGATPACSVDALETQIDSALAQTNSAVDFSFLVERSDGRRFAYDRGSSTAQTSYESASTAKLVSAVIILRLVDQGYLNLTDRPQDHMSLWPITDTDSLHGMTLAQLLAFTSGLATGPLCLNSGDFDFAACVYNIASSNAGNGLVPGAKFYYANTHLQVAGLMAIRARGVNSWQDIFSEFKSQTGLFSTSTFDLPSSTNPRLAGGMHWTAEEYMAFLQALKNGSLLSPGLQATMLSDQTATAVMPTFPVFDALGEIWHYGFGLWHECQSAVFNCRAGARISSPGAYGAYPFWDRSKGYFGIVARTGNSFTEGVAIERGVRAQVEAWAACQ
jgi:CubicO group peptidase (beta-lactamase class C family)